jgi:hypothetical protein
MASASLTKTSNFLDEKSSRASGNGIAGTPAALRELYFNLQKYRSQFVKRRRLRSLCLYAPHLILDAASLVTDLVFRHHLADTMFPILNG